MINHNKQPNLKIGKQTEQSLHQQKNTDGK